MVQYLVVVGVLVCLVASNGLAVDNSITINLANYSPVKANNVYKQFYTLRGVSTTINVNHIGDEIGFFIIQIHTQSENITLTFNTNGKGSKDEVNMSVSGTNIGLVYGYSDNNAQFTVVQHNTRKIQSNETTNVLIAVTIYDEADPVPGGCNLSFDTKIAPYQMVTYTDDVIIVDSQPPSAYGVSCGMNKVQIDMYHIFLNEYNNLESHYFDMINNMLTVSDIKANGRKIRDVNGDGLSKFRRLYSSYRGTGEVFAIVATYHNRSSAYVPAASYGCDVTKWNETCVGPVSIQWKVLCALLLIFGLFVCMFGHRFFKFSVFLWGITFGILVTLILMSIQENITNQDKLVGPTTSSIIIGVAYGVIWLVIWWTYGVPLLTVHLAFLLCGFLFASIAFYAGLADLYIYTYNINYWVTFTSVVLAILLMWTSSAHHGHIFCCSLLGAYAFITALNYYIGGNLQHIIINTFRRITVKHFNVAIIDPPFQLTDMAQVVLWMILFGFGCYYQWRSQRGKPPFPPNRNLLRPNVAVYTERTPLIDSNVPQYV